MACMSMSIPTRPTKHQPEGEQASQPASSPVLLPLLQRHIAVLAHQGVQLRPDVIHGGVLLCLGGSAACSGCAAGGEGGAAAVAVRPGRAPAALGAAHCRCVDVALVLERAGSNAAALSAPSCFAAERWAGRGTPGTS